MMNDKNLLRGGIVGTVIAMLCCFTPVLVILLGFIGLSAIVGGLDYVLFPILFASLGLIGYALYLRSDNKGPSPKVIIIVLVIALSTILLWLEFRYALRISIAATTLVVVYGFYLRNSSTA